MLSPDEPVQGVALYAEFKMNKAVSQLLVTPDGYTEDGTLVGVTTLHRVNTETEPERPWGITATTPLADVEVAIEDDQCDPYTEERFKESLTLLEQYQKGGWVPVGPAFFVEVSTKDLTDIAAARPPSKLLYRARQCKIAYGYPTESTL